MDLEDHVEDLAADLDVEEAEVRESLENLLEFDVPVDEAKQSLRRRYGDTGGGSAGPEHVNVADVDTGSGNVSVTARVLTVGKRPIRYEGEDRTIMEGELADETGTISYTAWQEFDLEPGDTVSIGNAGVREWEGHPELNLGQSTTVEVLEEELEVPYEVGGERELRDLEPGDRGRTVTVRVVEVEERTIDGRDGETPILSGVLADESARLPFTDWEPREAIEAGADLTMENVYVREFRGVPSVNLSTFSTVRPAEQSVAIGGPERLSVREAVGRGGVYDVELTGTLVEVRDNSGLIQRCPECNRLTQTGQCRTHGDVDPVDDLRLKAILDDGTGTVTAVLDADQTADLYGGGVEAAREAAREAMDQSVVADDLAETVLGREYRVRGHLTVDEYGATVEVTDFEEPAEDPADLARDLLATAAASGTAGGDAADAGADPATDGGPEVTR
ncbi:MAG: Single-stranded DNA binding protein [Halobacteriaceae archaeon]